MATIVISVSNTTRNNDNIKIKNLHEIYLDFHLNADIFKPYFYWKSFNDITLIATIVISASNTNRINNNINLKNLHEIYHYFHLITTTLKVHFSWKSFYDTTLISTIITRASNTTRNYNSINMKNWHEIYPDFHLITATLSPISTGNYSTTQL